MAMSGQFRLTVGGLMQLAADTQSTGLDNFLRLRPRRACDAATRTGAENGITVIDGDCRSWSTAAEPGHKMLRLSAKATGKALGRIEASRWETMKPAGSNVRIGPRSLLGDCTGAHFSPDRVG